MKKKENGLFSVLQRVGRSFMLPIALLPIAGLLLGVGSSLTNATTIEAYNLGAILGPGTFLNSVMQILAQTGDIIFGNLPLIFALGVALGMAEKEHGTAVLSAAIAFFVMHQTISTLLKINGQLVEGAMLEGTVSNVVGIQSLQMGVFGGIIVGLGVAALHNRFYKIELPTVISFFGGVRFIPIISTFVYILVGIAMYFIWPYIQRAIYSLGGLVLNSGYFGTLIYGTIERGLIPFGLHHVFYIPFWQTGLGGSMVIDGTTVQGAQNIFFAQLASPSTTQFSVEATRFMSGKFPFMIFGLPGAALAMYSVAKPTKKKVAGGLLLSAALTSILTGITEPLEFTFLFVAPVLYVIH
ncbi:MAG: PTS glucose transporter subunit IIA, partial [Ruminococcaceae bacterium]|nr:PTS glucose transporter subunit IIA [Oscillospiraceae bacterium]